jgi:hypothetical protein
VDAHQERSAQPRKEVRLEQHRPSVP